MVTDLPGFRAGMLEFLAAAERDKKAIPDSLWYRDRAFGRDHAPDLAIPVRDRLLSLAGNFRSESLWVGGADIVIRGDALVALGAGPLVEEKAGFWHLEKDKRGYERLV